MEPILLKEFPPMGQSIFNCLDLKSIIAFETALVHIYREDSQKPNSKNGGAFLL